MSAAALQSMLASDALHHTSPEFLRSADAAFARLAETGRATTSRHRKPAYTKCTDASAPRAITAGIAELKQALLDSEKAYLATLAIGAVCSRAARIEADLAKCCHGAQAQYQ